MAWMVCFNIYSRRWGGGWGGGGAQTLYFTNTYDKKLDSNSNSGSCGFAQNTPNYISDVKNSEICKENNVTHIFQVHVGLKDNMQ